MPASHPLPEADDSIEQCDQMTPVGAQFESERRAFRLEEVPGLRAGGEQASAIPLVVRRELYRGLDECAYRIVDFRALHFVRSGRGAHVINGHPFNMVRGNVYTIAPGEIHFYKGASEVVIDAFYFSDTLFSTDERRALGQLPGASMLLAQPESVGVDQNGQAANGYFLHLSPEQQLRVEETITAIRRELTRSEEAFHFSARARLWCLLVQLASWRGDNSPAPVPGPNMHMSEVLRFTEANFQSPLSVDQLASLTHYSRNHFTYLFTQEVGMAPAAYIRHLRLQHGQKLLRETVLPATDVARLCGFSDCTIFARAFQRAFHQTPTAYRKTHKSKRAVRRDA